MFARSVSDLSALRDRPRRLLAVFPHPDDESYGPAGTLARAGRDPEAASVVFCLTSGEASSIGPERGLSPEQVAALREKRLDEVARLLSLDGMLRARLPDGQLAFRSLAENAAVIAEVLDSFEPHVILAHDPRGVNAHPDHIATHWALRHALIGRAPVRVAMVAYPQSVVDSIAPRLLFPTPQNDIDIEIALTPEEVDAKEAALRVHEAMVTMRENGDPEKIWRPPVERFSLLGERLPRQVDDVFASPSDTAI